MSGRSKIASNPDLQAFLAERLDDLAYAQLAAAARARFGPAAPGKSGIACWAVEIGRPRPYAPSKIDRDPALRAFLAERLDGLTYLDLAAAARARFGPAAPGKSAIAVWAAEIGRPRPPRKIDRDPELRAFVEAEAGRLGPEALVAALRERFGERAPARSTLYSWLRVHRARCVGRRRGRGLPDRDPRHARRAARMAQDAREAPSGPGERPGPRCAPTFMKPRLKTILRGGLAPESAEPCLWCRRTPQRRRRRRRSEPFCGAACRRAFRDAATALALRGIAETQLSPAEVRAAAFFGAVGLGAASKIDGLRRGAEPLGRE